MNIEIDISALRTQCRTALEEGVVARLIQHEMDRICKKHQEVASKEMQDFVARVVVNSDIGFALDSTVVKISIPDTK